MAYINCDVQNYNSKRRRVMSDETTAHVDKMGDERFEDTLSSLIGLHSPRYNSSTGFFEDLKCALAMEYSDTLPSALLTSMTSHVNIETREDALYSRLDILESSYPQEISQLREFYRCQAAYFDVDEATQSLSLHSNSEKHNMIDRFEQSLDLLECADKENKLRLRKKSRPLRHGYAKQLLEDWHRSNPQHTFPPPGTLARSEHKHSDLRVIGQTLGDASRKRKLEVCE